MTGWRGGKKRNNSDSLKSILLIFQEFAEHLPEDFSGSQAGEFKSNGEAETLGSQTDAPRQIEHILQRWKIYSICRTIPTSIENSQRAGLDARCVANQNPPAQRAPSANRCGIRHPRGHDPARDGSAGKVLSTSSKVRRLSIT